MTARPLILIRPAVESDFDRLLAIDQTCFPPGIAYGAGELHYYIHLKQASTLVAECEGRIAGFLIMTRGSRHATLVTLDVVESYRRRGVGGALLDRSEQILSESAVSRYQLQVETANSGAIEFYRKAGYTVRRAIPGYYGEGLDAYLMEKTLEDPRGW
jgi:ribosomal-protein-alanine N-acetyltransferase